MNYHHLKKYRIPVKRPYRGHSMKGTFQPGDLLALVKTPFNNIRPGDIIVFKKDSSREEIEEIVHRVARRSACGLITRGDATILDDKAVVSENDLVGRVFQKERNGRISTVHGGWLGLCRGGCLHCYWGIRRWVVRTIQPLYDMLKQLGIISRIWKPEITRVCLKTRDGSCIQFLYNKRVIARFWPGEDRFECKKPWDLVVKEEDRR